MQLVCASYETKLGQRDASTRPMTVLVYQGSPVIDRSIFPWPADRLIAGPTLCDSSTIVCTRDKCSQVNFERQGFRNTHKLLFCKRVHILKIKNILHLSFRYFFQFLIRKLKLTEDIDIIPYRIIYIKKCLLSHIREIKIRKSTRYNFSIKVLFFLRLNQSFCSAQFRGSYQRISVSRDVLPQLMHSRH